MMDTFINDIKYGIRMLLHRPSLTAVAVLSLALGIGANTTIFTWVKSVLLDPLPGVANPDEFVVVGIRTPSGSQANLSFPDYVDYRDQATSVLSGIVVQDDVIIAIGQSDGSGEPQRLWGSIVSGNYFDVLGVKPTLGRTFLPEEYQTNGTHPVAVIAYRVWQRQFNGDPGVVGRNVLLANHAFTIVGVAPENFIGTFMGLATDIWVPITMEGQIVPGSNRLDGRGQRFLQALARLKPGITKQQASTALNTVAKQLSNEYPNTNDGRSAAVYSIWESPWGAVVVLGPVLFVLSAVVALVLMIACANVANLLLARAVSRRREVAMRLSLGASRVRLIQQLLTESLILAILGGIGGVIIAYWTSGSLMAFVPPTDAPIRFNLGIDATTLLFALGISLITGIIFGLAPAIHISSPSLVTALKEEAGGAIGGFRRSRIRSFLVVAQVAVSIVLLIGAGLFVRSLRKANEIDTGFGARNALLVAYDLASLGYTPDRGMLFHKQLLERITALPGVRLASLTRRVPLGFSGSSSSGMSIEGYEPAPNEEIQIEYNTVGPRYLQTMEIPIVSGRDFAGTDSADAPHRVIINETMAKRYWPGREALGGRLRFGGTWREVIGIAKDGKYQSLSESPMSIVYVPVLQAYQSGMILLVNTEGIAANLLPAVRMEVRNLDAGLPLFEVKTLEQHLEIAVFVQNMAATLLSIMGFVALLLATVGLYGVIAYAVTQRTKEVGIRIALGAQRSDILRMILRQGMVLAGTGMITGLALAIGSTRFLSSLLHGVSATDPLVFVAVPAILMFVTGLASYIPARRATRTDPLISLRYE